MASAEAESGRGVRRETDGPPCRRCSNKDWDVTVRPKSRFRWAVEVLFAAPDVWIFQSESAGWPGKTYERWTCTKCGRAARVS